MTSVVINSILILKCLILLHNWKIMIAEGCRIIIISVQIQYSLTCHAESRIELSRIASQVAVISESTINVKNSRGVAMTAIQARGISSTRGECVNALGVMHDTRRAYRALVQSVRSAKNHHALLLSKDYRARGCFPPSSPPTCYVPRRKVVRIAK